MSERHRPVTEETYDEKKMMKDDVPPSHFEQQRERWQREGLSGIEKDKLMRRKAELEAKVANGMPTHTEMWKPTPENIQKHLGWEKAWGNEIRELKAINRRLEPSNPGAGRIEYLRKQGEADKLAKWS